MTLAIHYPDRLEKFIASDILNGPNKGEFHYGEPRVTFAMEHGMKAIAPQLVVAGFTAKAHNFSEWNKALTMISEASPDPVGSACEC